MDTKKKGNYGEDIAVEYLLTKGYTIESRNYRTKLGEIDIIARAPDGTLVFAEVKASFGKMCGNPLFRVTQSKQNTLAKMAKFYMHAHKMTNQPCRMDVIGISGGKADHIPNAFFV